MHFTNWAHAMSVTVVSSAQTKLQQILLPKHIRDGIKLLTLFFFLILLSFNDSEPNVMLMMKLNLHYLCTTLPCNDKPGNSITIRVL